MKNKSGKLIALLSLFLIVLFTTPARALLDNQGKEFFMAFMPNYSGAGNFVELHLTGDVATDVTVEYPVNSPIFTTTVLIVPGTVTIVELPVSAAQGWTAGTVQNNAVRAFADEEFIAYMTNRRELTSDAALAFPKDVLNTDYIVASFFSNIATVNRSHFAVVAAFDNTTVTITPSANLIGGFTAGVPFNITLNIGDAFLGSGTTTGSAGDLTGTIIKADKPIAMTNGHRCANVPPNTAFCDHIFEVAQPVQTWGNGALVSPLPNRPSGSVYRIISSEDNTTVEQDGAVIGNINRGEFIDTGGLAGAHRFSADKPIFVVQYMTGSTFSGAIPIGDPAMGNMIPTEQYLQSYTFSTVGGAQFQQNFVSIIADDTDISGGTILLDGASIPAGDFTPIPGTGFSYTVQSLSAGSHRTSSNGFHGITIEGYNSDDSYIFPGGAKFAFINPTGDTNPPICDVTVTDITATGTATDNRPSEDVNNNSVLDPGEDLNNNGQIDEDTGIFFVELDGASTNLVLNVDSFTPGDGSVNYTVSLADSNQPGAGTVIATDGAGNTCQVQIDLTPALADSTAPECFLAEVIPGPPTQIKVHTQDGGSGLKSIMPTIAENVFIDIPPFTAGTNDLVIVTATKDDPNLKSRVELEVMDVADNTTTCDPVITLVIREKGKPVTETLWNIPEQESNITVENGDPGIKNLEVVVNGTKFQLAGLADNQERTIDVSSAMIAGNNNTITLTAKGKPGGSATVVISD